MAQQIQLTGYQGPRGFSAEQIYNPARQILQQGEQVTGQMSRVSDQLARRQQSDIEALSSFSSTLSKFITDRAEEDKKNKIASGYAKYIRGEVGIPKKDQQQFQVKAAVLEAGADKDLAVANAVAASGTSPGTASTILATSPALKGWEQYGAAVAAAQLAPSNLETFLTSRKNSDKPVTLADGRQVIPSQAKGYEIADVTRALTQQWVLEYGLDRINPQVVQEHGGFNLAMAEREVLRSWMKESDERDLKERQYNAAIKMHNTVEMGLTPQGAIDWQNTSFNDGMRDFRDPVIVNEKQLEAVEQRVDVYIANGDVENARLLLNNLEMAPLRGTKMTFGQKNKAKFDLLRAKLNEGRKNNAAFSNSEEAAGLRYLYQQFQELRRTLPPEQLAPHRKALEKTLANKGTPAALEISNELATSDSSIRLTNQIRSQIEAGNKKPGGGYLWTESEIDLLVNSKDIEPEDADALKKLLPDVPSVVELGKGVGTGIVMPLVKGQILKDLTNGGATYAADAGFRSRIDGAINGAMRVAFDTLSSKWQAQFEKTGKYPNDTTVAREWQAETERILRNPREEFYINKKGDIPNLGKGGLPTGQAIEIQSPVASPEQLRSLRSKSGPYPTMQATALRTNPSDFDIYQSIISGGGNLPPEVMAAAKMAGFNSEDAWMAHQAKLLQNKTYTPNPNKLASYQRNAAINRNAADVIRNPRSTRAQIRAALELINSGGVKPIRSETFGAGDFGGLAETTSSGEGGFDSVNKGTAGDTPQGMKLTSMRLGDVQKLQQRFNATNGREGVFAVGFAQWTANGQLDMAIKAAGLSPDDKFTPENQLKMFWAYILKTDKQPDLRDYLLGKHNSLDRAQEAFANEWAAAPGLNGKSKYEGVAGNKATIPAIKLRAALLNARRELKQLTDSGIDPFQ